jgi:hypothetical protein
MIPWWWWEGPPISRRWRSFWPATLTSLWWDRKGDWNRAHSIAQDIPTAQGSAVHAYLHREEGVLWNADYWYRRAGRPRPGISLEAEWEALVLEMLTG